MFAVDEIPNRAKLKAGYKLAESPALPDSSTYPDTVQGRARYILDRMKFHRYSLLLGETFQPETLF